MCGPKTTDFTTNTSRRSLSFLSLHKGKVKRYERLIVALALTTSGGVGRGASLEDSRSQVCPSLSTSNENIMWAPLHIPRTDTNIRTKTNAENVKWHVCLLAVHPDAFEIQAGTPGSRQAKLRDCAPSIPLAASVPYVTSRRRGKINVNKHKQIRKWSRP